MAYLRALYDEGKVKVGFVLGKAKLALRPEPSIPCLELCGGVLAVEMAEHILDELDHKPKAVRFFCDSRLILGYIYNESRFFVDPQDPADLVTRSIGASQLNNTMWFTGPRFLYKQAQAQQQHDFELVNPETDAEARPCVTSFST